MPVTMFDGWFVAGLRFDILFGDVVAISNRLAGLLPGKHENLPSGIPDFYGFPVAVRPESGPEARFQARKHYCIT